ncbi:MAG TPA: hypothetical protein VKV80_18175 [Streptosporangiaceae bacterium]|nr:hypothetical protein [Streptosporangiaceae bacterium]
MPLRRPQRWRLLFLLVCLAASARLIFGARVEQQPVRDLGYSDFVSQVDSHKVKQVQIDSDGRVTARATPGFSGADLANLANEAAIEAVRGGREILTPVDFDRARDRLLLGLRDASAVLLPDERRAVAVHESGHALVAALCEAADPVAKVTILPAGQALGATHQLPLDERHLLSETALRTSLAVRLAGRAAELVVSGEGSTGAASDLVQATDLATRMVREFGLSAKLGPVGYGTASPTYLGGDQVTLRTYAEATQRAIDMEVAALLQDAEQTATTLLETHRRQLDALTSLLLEQETVDGPVVYDLAGRPLQGPAGQAARH